MRLDIEEQHKNAHQSIFNALRSAMIQVTVRKEQNAGIQRARFAVGKDDGINAGNDFGIGRQATTYEIFQLQQRGLFVSSPGPILLRLAASAADKRES